MIPEITMSNLKNNFLGTKLLGRRRAVVAKFDSLEESLIHVTGADDFQ
jgi:hypothetical protein